MTEAISLSRKILERIRANEKIVISRHTRPDGDAVGASLGLARILRRTFPEKQILAVGDDHSETFAFLGADDEQPDDRFYADALLIVLDTAAFDRISNSKASLAREVIKIDHHIDDKPFGNLSWVEETRSSTCELITAFWMEYREELLMDAEAALCLYTGIVTDSGDFRFRGVSGETLRCAAALLDFGIDTESMYAHIKNEDFELVKLRSLMVKRIRMTPNGAAYLHITRRMQETYRLNNEQASSFVSVMESIQGSLIWMAFIDNMTPDAEGRMTTRVRLRSRCFPIKDLASHYHGGGHAMASGATVYSAREMRALIADADALLGAYKASHDGWM